MRNVFDFLEPRPAMPTDLETLAEFDATFDRAVAGDGAIDYQLAAPRWQFICHIADTRPVVLHGSGNPTIARFEPRQPEDTTEFGNRNAVYAASDGLWPMYFAILDRDRHQMSLINSAVRPVQPDGTMGEHLYFFSICEKALTAEPWRRGTLYFLPRDTFEQQPVVEMAGVRAVIQQWASAEPVTPLARIEIVPEDFPLLHRIRGHDRESTFARARAEPDGFPWIDQLGCTAAGGLLSPAPMHTNDKSIIHVIGGGLAGSEAAWQAAEAGARVILHEMRPVQKTDAHQTDSLAELVCSNSFRSDDYRHNAVGLLHEEMRRCNSLIMRAADAHKLPAGGALAVDRDAFADAVTAAIHNHPGISIERGEVAGLPPQDWANVVVATGPLTSPALAEAIQGLTGEDSLAFFDAIAPIVHKDSIDMDVVWAQSRYDKVGPMGDGRDYLNCPMDEAQYNRFVDALLSAPLHQFKDWEKVPYFDGCLPIEVMAERGRDTLRWGPMKPVGLTNPRNPTVKAHAIVQLRQDNALGTLWNMVGFQTKMRYGVQTEIFRLIPGLENAQFARLGGLHRNTFLNSPKVLGPDLRLKAMPRLRFAGQVTGVEGYVESAAVGLMAGRLAAADARGETLTIPPATTAMGALINHITGGHIEAEAYSGARSFQPMNVNFGLFPPVSIKKPEGHVGRWKSTEKTIAKKEAITARALEDIMAWA